MRVWNVDGNKLFKSVVVDGNVENVFFNSKLAEKVVNQYKTS